MTKFFARGKYPLVFTVLFLLFAPALGAEIPYDTYNYNYRREVVFTPPAYIPSYSVGGATLGIGEFFSPQDLYAAADGRVYVADTGNNRIVVLDPQMKKVETIIDGFYDGGVLERFSMPYGITMDDQGLLYIADSDNRRIVVLDDGVLVRYIQNPQSDVLPPGFVFTPLKLELDYAGRVYVIAKGMFQGIMQFDTDGTFTGFYGTIEVSISPWQKFWRRFATKSQRQRGMLFIPTEFTGISIDKEGFLYATNFDFTGIQAVRRLNPSGVDVIRMGENGNLGGDLRIESLNGYGGVSRIVDVAVRDKGMYSLLDSRRGRIFTYDREGSLLYIFGGLGTQAGTFRSPTAIAQGANGDILVLDALHKEIMAFEVTGYGQLINDAVGLRFDGKGAESVDKWRQVLLYDENFLLANTGIGKAYLSSGDNELAMHYLRLGMSRINYSIAFKRWRNNILREWIFIIPVIIAAVAIFTVIRKRLRVYKRPAVFTGNKTIGGKGRYLFRVLVHPLDSFYEIRHREAGSVVLALVCVVLFSFSYTINRIYAGFVVNDIDPASIDILAELSAVLLLYILFCVGNWSITCLMDGEGRFSDIVTVTGYAFLPLILTIIPATIFSGFIAQGEELYYYLVIGIGILWTFILILSGIMTVHNYTLAKVLLTLVLTALSMLVLIFISVLLISLLDQAVNFFKRIYADLVYRQ